MNYSAPSAGPRANNGNQQMRVPHENSNLNDIPKGNTREQTSMWQQQADYFDSGFNSGATSQSPSISGRDEGFNNEQYTFGWDQPQIPTAYDQRANNQGFQHENFSATVFPGSQGNILSTQFETTQRQVQPIQIQNQTADNSINYWDDIDLTNLPIAELISLLNDEDQVVVNQVATIVYKLSKHEDGVQAIINSPQMVAALVRVILISTDEEAVRETTGTLLNLAQHEQGRRVIYESEGIYPLVKLLSSPTESILSPVITTLHKLLLHQKGSKMAVRLAGGLPKMVPLLRRNNLQFLAIVADCLQVLALGNPESKLIILANQGHVELVRIMRTYDYEKLLWTTSRALKVLSACPSNKPAIVEAGGMQALAMQLDHQSQRLVQNCLWTLRNLSDAGTKESIDGLLQRLVQLLGSNDISIVTCTAEILANLTCHNIRNKVIVCRMGGIEAFVRTLILAGDNNEIIEPVMCAIKHLTNPHSDADKARNDVRLNYAIPVIMKILNCPSSPWPVIKAVIGLIRNLTLCSANYVPLREQGAVQHLVQLLIAAYQDFLRQRSSNNNRSMQVERVNTEAIVEGTLAAIQNLASEPESRTIIRNFNVIPIFQQLRYSENEKVQLLAAGVLTELSSAKEMIVQQVAAAPVTGLLQSRNESVASMVPPVRSRMSETNPQELSMQLSHSQQRMDEEWPQDLASMLPPTELHQMFQDSQGPPNGHSNHDRGPYPQSFDQGPVDSMQRLEIGGHHGSNYVPMEINQPQDMAFNNMDTMPQPPEQLPDWYDMYLQ
uniref:Armadillo segment polarity protein n=1 Tax=Strigamia maritima TaxID=126957 RepID=T1INN6_STRMM